MHVISTTHLDPIDALRAALVDGRYETARRLGDDALRRCLPADRQTIGMLLHEAYRRLGAIPDAIAVLEMLDPDTPDERLELLQARAEDYFRFRNYDFYRNSDYERSGITGDEYAELMLARCHDALEEAKGLATTTRQRRQVADLLRRCGFAEEAERYCASGACVDGTPADIAASGVLTGRLTDDAGHPVAGARVTLGLPVTVVEKAPDAFHHDIGYRPEIGPVDTRVTDTDADGRYTFTDLPAGRHAFLAVTRDAAVDLMQTRFLAQEIDVRDGATTTFDCTVAAWHSAPAQPAASPFPEVLARGGVAYRRVAQELLRNPFHYDFPRQLLTLALPPGVPANPAQLLLLDTAMEAAQPFQLVAGNLSFFAELPALADRGYALYLAEEGEAETPALPGDLRLTIADGGATAVLETGRVAFRLGWGSTKPALPPILAVRGDDGAWRGEGRFRLPDGVSMVTRRTELLAVGPLYLRLGMTYQLSTGESYTLTLTAHQGEAYLLAHEVSPALAGAAFEFSLREFSGGRGFLHWTPENGGRHWHTLAAEDSLRARLQESVPWWIPPQGFGYAMTSDGLAAQDYIGVFTQRRGEWIDRAFAEIAQGPGDDHRELDWPFPEMVGSTISMITAHTDAGGDAFFRWGFFDGERYWGLLVSTLARNDGTMKEISSVQHKNSSPRLQDFKEWALDVEDTTDRPCLLTTRAELEALRAKVASPVFARYWEEIASGRLHGAAGLRFLVDGDPVTAWRKKREIVGVAHLYARMTLLGRDFGDMYSPVGVRPLSEWAEDYDCLAGSGVFTPEEERLVRRFFVALAHLYLHPDFMNWHYGARNANFEADRILAIGTVGLVFPGHPDAELFTTHARERLTQMLAIYCTPGSGKWYENPACYYLHSLKCYGLLAYHLARQGYCRVTEIPRLREFLSWGVTLVTPAIPHDAVFLTNGGSDAEYRRQEAVRRIPPVGDHAQLGPWVPEIYPLMASLFDAEDPAFANRLRWAYQVGGAHGGYHSLIPLLFAALTEDDLRPAALETPVSRRLEGFGAVLRGAVNTPREFYLLVKQGPGGYRYHRTEGSFLLVADGKPLVYDGGEAGETWRHSTLSFYDTHMPLAPGHVERTAFFPSLEFVQGVHPVALQPGQPVFMSDSCHHELVPQAYARYHEPHPADVRAFAWVKDDYVIVHDDLRLDPAVPAYWHLQVVADAQHGDLGEGLRFHGRYGTDLQVILPDQPLAETTITRQPMMFYHIPPERSFTMQHLQARAEAPGHYLAVLRPLTAGQAPVRARLLAGGAGVAVSGEGIADALFFAREAIEYADGDLAFSGRYGAVLRRPGSTALILLDSGVLQQGEIRLESHGVAVEATVTPDGVELTVQGTGTLALTLDGSTTTLTLDGTCTTARLARG
jgi:hypothetical protein